jgi:hypothetical protein
MHGALITDLIHCEEGKQLGQRARLADRATTRRAASDTAGGLREFAVKGDLPTYYWSTFSSHHPVCRSIM